MIKSVYIFAAGHSGSTLLDLLFGSHSQIESLGEISQLPKNLALNTTCTCSKPVRECTFWRAVLANLKKRSGLDLLAAPYSMDLGHIGAVIVKDPTHQTRAYKMRCRLERALRYAVHRAGLSDFGPVTRRFDRRVKNNFLLYDAVRSVSGAQIVVDSSKDYIKGIDLYRADPESTRAILLVRDGRGVCLSGMRRGLSREASVRAWKNYYSRTLALIDRFVHEEHLWLVRYEDLVQSPADALEKICRFLGISYEPEMLEFAAHEHHITNGNNMRFAKTSEIREDRAWREELGSVDLDYFRSRAGSLACRLGYSLDIG